MEEEMMLNQQTHDQEMEVKRMKFEELKSDREYELEQRRLYIKEEAMKQQAEDARRKDELQATQLGIQKTMFELLSKFAK